MEIIEQLLTKLNDEQMKPVLDTEGAVLVIAGAGSGKTRVLTTRIAYLVLEEKVNPDNVLAVTFTNKAANEMKERLTRFIGSIGGMWVSTLHSMCVKILRSDIDKIGYDRNFTIYDDTDKEKVLKRIIEDLGLEVDVIFKLAKSMIATAKNDCVEAKDFMKVYSDQKFAQDIENVYIQYEDALSRSNALDFDDLLFKTYILFRDHGEVADKYAEKFQYIHVDEFQDTNKVQFAIIQRMSYKHGNIFVVGDDDQSIYGWRGAKIENILFFDDVYRGAKVYKLQRNYRSTKKIIELANSIISHNTMRRQKELWTENSDGTKVEVFVGDDENGEATYTAIQIKRLMERTDLKYKDFAVFMRVNAISRAFEQEFTKYGIPYKVFGGFRFFERKEIKDVLSYLKVINNYKDDEAFLRSISSPKRGIGDKTLSELREYASGKYLSMFESIDVIDFSGIKGSARIKLINYKNLLESFKTFSDNHTVAETIQEIFDKTGYLDQFAEKSEENTSKLYNLSELKNSAEEFLKDNQGANLSDYLNSVTLSSDTDDINNDDSVTVATIHSVKGLEYKVVFVSGLDEKIIPIARSFGSDSEMEEERRLMYVAVTRAKERLYLTRATSRYLYGHREFMTQSRFLKEAQEVISPVREPKEQIFTSYGKKEDYSRYDNDRAFESQEKSSGYSSNYAKKFLNDNKPKENVGVDYGKYKRGVTVEHKKFGSGTIIDVKGSGETLTVDVAFKGFGIKTLSVKFAPMEIK